MYHSNECHCSWHPKCSPQICIMLTTRSWRRPLDWETIFSGGNYGLKLNIKKTEHRGLGPIQFVRWALMNVCESQISEELRFKRKGRPSGCDPTSQHGVVEMWRKSSVILWSTMIPRLSKPEIYRIIICPTVMYSSKCCFMTRRVGRG